MTALPTPPGAAVEVATWPPVETLDVDGWSAGFSGGFTRRANSVAPLRVPSDVEAALARVEALAAERGVPPRFRVCAGAAPPDLGDLLVARGYRPAAGAAVLVRDLPLDPADVRPAPPGTTLTVAPDPHDEWLAGWLGVKAAGATVDVAAARAVVSGCAADYVTARDASGVVGVVRAAYAGGWAGLSCLMVAPRARRAGLARALTAGAAAAAVQRGVRRAFLQVEEGNDAARALYDGLGFRLAETYLYLERSGESSGDGRGGAGADAGARGDRRPGRLGA